MTKISDMFPSKYLKADDLDDQEVTMRIAKVVQETMKDDQQRDIEKWIVYFEAEKKGLVLNMTNAKAIAYFCGDDNKDWPGNEIILYPDIVPFRGEMKPAIRIRGTKIKRTTPPRNEFKSGLAKPLHEPDYDEEGYPIK